MQAASTGIPNIRWTSPSHWEYVAEGAATIVFAYNGPSRPPFDGKVFRLKKALLAATSTNTDLSERDAEDEVRFQHEIVARLLSDRVPDISVVRVEPGWLEQLERLSEERRPSWRRAVDRIDTRRSQGVLAANLIGGYVIAVEIKPKWGFLPQSTYLSPSTALTKTRYCRFCMHKHFKSLSAGDEWNQGQSLYCPLDLYSGNMDRMRRAIGCLWDDWIASRGATNNFRVFVRGKKVDTWDNTSSPITTSSDSSSYFSKDRIMDCLVDALKATTVLADIQHLQQTLDPLDIEGLSAYHTSIFPSQPFGAMQSQPSVEEWSSFINSCLSDIVPSSEPERLRHFVLAYLLSATFKDCSIIIRIPFDTAASPRVYVIDVDVKDIGKLGKWEELDKKIVESFASRSNQPTCRG